MYYYIWILFEITFMFSIKLMLSFHFPSFFLSFTKGNECEEFRDLLNIPKMNVFHFPKYPTEDFL